MLRAAREKLIKMYWCISFQQVYPQLGINDRNNHNYWRRTFAIIYLYLNLLKLGCEGCGDLSPVRGQYLLQKNVKKSKITNLL
jgi:hypothetical protein